MLNNATSQMLTGSNPLLSAAQIYLDQARQQKTDQNLDVALVLYDQAQVAFRNIADAHQLTPSLSALKMAFKKAHTPQITEEKKLQENIAAAYFERAEVLIELGKHEQDKKARDRYEEKARASYQKAKEWGHPEAEEQLNSLNVTSPSLLEQAKSCLSSMQTFLYTPLRTPSNAIVVCAPSQALLHFPPVAPRRR